MTELGGENLGMGFNLQLVPECLSEPIEGELGISYEKSRDFKAMVMWLPNDEFIALIQRRVLQAFESQELRNENKDCKIIKSIE